MHRLDLRYGPYLPLYTAVVEEHADACVTYIPRPSALQHADSGNPLL